MNSAMYELVNFIVQYRLIFILLAMTIAMIIVFILGYQVYLTFLKMQEEKELEENNLKILDFSQLPKSKRGSLLRRVLSPEGVNPNPLKYFSMSDAGQEIFIRSFTIERMPKRTDFANTFAEIMDYQNCTSSIFIDPIPEKKMELKFDKQINILDGEYDAAIEGNNTNRKRKINSQFQETNGWAEEAESGENRFFNVGMIFSIWATSERELNNLSDAFVAKASEKSVILTSCFGVHAEAYLSNAPFNQIFDSLHSKIHASSAVEWHLMDKKSLATIFNYTQTSFSHRNGFYLGHDMRSGKPILFDPYDASHDGYTIVVAGKTNSGKSTLIKILQSRLALKNYKFVCIDSQTRKGTSEGEYASIATMLNGVNYQIKNNAEFLMNLYEVAESKILLKDSDVSGYEVRTLELNDSISIIVNNLLTMIQDTETINDFQLHTHIEDILKESTRELFEVRGIYNGDADSLYEIGQTVIDGNLTSGMVKKKLPTISEHYKLLLKKHKNNPNPEKNKAYDLILTKLKDFVKEIYYAKDSLTYFTREEYMKLPKDEEMMMRYILKENGEKEYVVSVIGTRAYYDGQSTVSIDKDCPFVNIDISQLPEKERKLARIIGMSFINENFIKKNSESIKDADKLMAIFDEAHENYAIEPCRVTIDNVVRTARKRHVGVILSTQTLIEHEKYSETRNILSQAAVKIVFRQDEQDREYLLKTLPITETQVERIFELGGNRDDEEDTLAGENKNKHRGECCIIDNKKVAFCKVDYFKSVEAKAVDTSAEELAKIFTIKSAS